MVNKKLLALSALPLLALSACSGASSALSSLATKPYTPKMEDAKYWQRNTASSALYLHGPKAQQMLHKNIATCVNEIKELERLGEIRRAVPANYNSGNEIETRTASNQDLAQWDTPARDGYLYNEHVDYHDFETCMDSKGWERVKNMPYSEVDIAAQQYLDRYEKKKKKSSDMGRENVTTLHATSTNFPSQINVNE